MNKKLLSLYGLKWNPFSSELPIEGLMSTPKIENFCWRIEQVLVREGGFALINGDPGTGKSVALRLLSERLMRLGEVKVGAMEHPQSNVADFYREMGDLFEVPLKPHNRWGGFKSLRERWCAHIDSTLVRPVLLIDESQQMNAVVLSELRLLTSTRFDSRTILSVVLSGDDRLIEKLRQNELLPLGSRIRIRLTMDYATPEELLSCLRHLLTTAGNARLMTNELMITLCDHAAGNYRVLTNMAGELLAVAAQKECTKLDEKLYLEVFSAPGAKKSTAPGKKQKTRGRR
ncbi:MAG: AAA family ATPase [Candidatus Eisenbacteria bacterium]|nr:AAA family ATPase [Planctomycetota bacterium]MBU1698563.1 AAA family ATPase [Candidatus Eisenbacteria bacterium]